MVPFYDSGPSPLEQHGRVLMIQCYVGKSRKQSYTTLTAIVFYGGKNAEEKIWKEIYQNTVIDFIRVLDFFPFNFTVVILFL